MGLVFRWDDDYYRAIRPRTAALAKELFDEGIVAHLVTSGFLCPHEISDIQVEGFAFTVRSEKATFDSITARSFPYSVLRQAALKWLDANIFLNDRNLALCDAHYNNFLYFPGAEPRWIDLGSIIRMDESRNPYIGIKEFHRFYFAPLVASAKHPDISAMIRSHAMTSGRGLERVEAEYLTGSPVAKNGRDRGEPLRAMREALVAMAPSWADDDKPAVPVLEAEIDEQVKAILAQRIRPGDSVLDLGGADGLRLGLHAAQAGARTLFADHDEDALARCWAVARTVPIGRTALVSEHPMQGRQTADIVLALGLPSRLAAERYHLDGVTRRLASYANRLLITDYPSAGDESDRHDAPRGPDYSLGYLLSRLQHYFDDVTVESCIRVSDTESNALIICSKNSPGRS